MPVSSDACAEPLVLAVGISGHRDPHPRALPQLRPSITRVLERPEEAFGLPIVILSSLAEGADRLVAEIALKRGHRLVAPLVDEDVTTGQDRDAAYRRAGVHVARECQLLLALWDGTDSGKPGGTWDIVAVQRAAGGAVVHIHAPRATKARPGAVVTHWPDRSGESWCAIRPASRATP